MEQSKTICIRVPKVLLKWFDHIASEMGVSRSELIKGMMINVVATYLAYGKFRKKIWYVDSTDEE